MVNVVAAEDLARKAAEELKKLSGKNPKAEQFAECSALTRLIKDALNLEAKANVDATFVARVLRLVVGVECQAAVIFHKTGNSHEIRKNDCCLIAAAGELLSMVDDRLFEKVWRRIWKAANWEDVLKMKKSLTLVKSIQLRAAVWVGKTSYKTGERVNKFVFPIFVNAIVRRLSGDKELRDNLRSLALADASETVAPLNDATGPVPASSTQVLTPASSAVTADEVRLLRNLARSVQSKANHFLESARSDYYDFEVKWSVVRGVSWVSEDAALSEMLGRSPSELPRTISERNWIGPGLGVLV